MGVILALLLGLFVSVSDNVNTVSEKDINSVIEAKEDSVEAFKTDNKKLPHYYAEEILCSLADSTWDDSRHNEILNDLKDKDIKLTGTVNRVRDNMDGCYIVFTQKRADGLKDGWAMITCNFSDEDQIDKMMKLKKGDVVTVVGHTDKYPVMGISLHNCYLK